jgi:uncharacterized protein (TIGR01244 family)
MKLCETESDGSICTLSQNRRNSAATHMTTDSGRTISPPRDGPSASFARRRFSSLSLFAVTFLLTLAVSLGWFYFHKPPRIVKAAENVLVSSQLRPGDLSGSETIVDVRPDREAIFQPTSAEMRKRAEEVGAAFYYIPVSHAGASEEAVRNLAEVLATAQKPVVLYCRTGRRAVRLFALTEASRIDGPNVDAILRMVENTGFSAADLKHGIEARVVLRGKKPDAKSP